MCCVFRKKLVVTFGSEDEPQLFLACFSGKFEPRCSYKVVLIKKACNAFVWKKHSTFICKHEFIMPLSIQGLYKLQR